MEEYKEIKEIYSGESAVLSEVQSSEGKIFIKKRLRKDTDASQRKRVLNDITILNEIPSVFLIPIIDYDVDNDFPYYVMPKADMNLTEYTQKKYGYSEIGMMDQIVQGIKILHQNQILHLDLNPKNVFVFINENGRINAKI
jgi:serine/threonine protein kinase